jgi:hypothetical protein
MVFHAFLLLDMFFLKKKCCQQYVNDLVDALLVYPTPPRSAPPTEPWESVAARMMAAYDRGESTDTAPAAGSAAGAVPPSPSAERTPAASSKPAFDPRNPQMLLARRRMMLMSSSSRPKSGGACEGGVFFLFVFFLFVFFNHPMK